MQADSPKPADLTVHSAMDIIMLASKALVASSRVETLAVEPKSLARCIELHSIACRCMVAASMLFRVHSQQDICKAVDAAIRGAATVRKAALSCPGTKHDDSQVPASHDPFSALETMDYQLHSSFQWALDRHNGSPDAIRSILSMISSVF